MKRDLDLARQILQKMEERSYAESGHTVAIEGYAGEDINYHMMLLNDAGLILAEDVSSQNALIWLPMHLTWAGHEFLDAARDEERWQKAKSITENRGGAVTFEVLAELLGKMMKEEIFGGTVRRSRPRKRK